MITDQTTLTFSTRIDIDEDTRTQINNLLNAELADLTDLYSMVKHAHWNVKGIHFIELHNLFDEQAERIEGMIDQIAERITQLGGYAHGTVRMAAGTSRITAWPLDATNGEEMLEALIERWGMMAKHTRIASADAADLGDTATEDLLIELQRVLDKDLWFLEAHLQG